MSRAIVQGLKFRKQPNALDSTKLAALLEEAYLKQRREPGFVKKKTFSPSTVGYGHGTCPRYWYLAFTGGYYVDKSDAQGIANMANGTKGHERIEQVFDDAGIVVAKEVEITLSDPPVRGFADVMIRFEGEVVIGEIKTARQESFTFRETTMKPSAYHLYQILIYMKATGKRNGFMFYENKNDQTFLVIPVEMTPENEEYLETALEWLREVYAAYEAQTPPKPVFQKRNKICKACPFYEWCWDDGVPEDFKETDEYQPAPEGVISIRKMEVPKVP